MGASRGIGLEFVNQLLSRGCDVVATMRQESSALRELQAKAAGSVVSGSSEGKLELLTMDVTDQASIRNAFQSLSSRLTADDANAKKLTHIIFNAGVYPSSGAGRALGAVDAQQMLDAYAVNTIGPLLVIQEFLPLLTSPVAKDVTGAGKENKKMGMLTRLPVYAILTSKVGSVDDNSGGGSYAYRSSKVRFRLC